MIGTKNKNRATGNGGRWLHLGAAGILQPLSEEFLYRSPSDVLRRSVRRVGRNVAEVRDDHA
ncbi:MAG: hypothetical protein KDI88_01940 [Gammaproteobacteria bacterium]|nr:hypothetical protein [Gammaproteobacteria bacterium]